jgi:hypothetical protein
VLALGALAILVGGALSGCGSSSSSSGGTGIDPAAAVPATAPLYVGATVNPDGDLKQNALAIGQRITHSKAPFAGLLELLRGGTGAKLDYDHDVKPWLGARAGLFVASIDGSEAGATLSGLLSKALSGGLSGILSAEGLGGLLRGKGTQGALVLDTSDAAKARSFLEARAHAQGAHAADYRGISYQVASSGTASGIVGNLAVIGSEAGLKSVVDTHFGGAALIHASPYATLAAKAEPGALANLYLDPDALFAAVTDQGKAAPLLGLAHQLLGSAKEAYVSLVPQANSVVVDADYLPRSSASSGKPGPTGAQALAQLPGESWLAVGVGDLGATLGHSAAGFRALASLGEGLTFGSFNLKGLLAPLGSRTLEPRRDLLSWMGAAGVFAKGNSLLNLRAGLVIDSKNPARSRAAIAKLAAAYRTDGATVESTSISGAEVAMTFKLTGFPLVLTMAFGQGKFVVGLGTASVQEAMNPQSTMANSTSAGSTAAPLGQGSKPSVVVEFSTLLSLLDSVGLNKAPGFSALVPYLQGLDTLVAGGEQLGGGVKRSRLVLGLQPPG